MISMSSNAVERSRMVRHPRTICVALVLFLALVACDSMELTIAVRPAEEGWLEVVNANDRVLDDASLLIEAFESEGATRTCGEINLQRWQPGQAVRVQVCAEKMRFTLTTDGETARFSYANGQLYRRIGRKEIPISQ
jgi:hypothetical protein